MAKTSKPNILIIWGDDIGQSNLSCYTKGLMGYRRPTSTASPTKACIFTDYYAEQSCTAGRAAFMIGQCGVPLRAQQGRDAGRGGRAQAEDPTIAELLKPLGYATGQFGKNHLGDRDEHLPTMHGFDEFFGNLYHLNAEEEPEDVDYPKRRTSPTSRRTSARAACCIAGPTARRPEDREHRPADQKAHGDVRRRVPGRGQDVHPGGSTTPASRSSCGSTPRTCTSGRM